VSAALQITASAGAGWFLSSFRVLTVGPRHFLFSVHPWYIFCFPASPLISVKAQPGEGLADAVLSDASASRFMGEGFSGLNNGFLNLEI